jgi:hypothetical protein
MASPTSKVLISYNGADRDWQSGSRARSTGAAINPLFRHGIFGWEEILFCGCGRLRQKRNLRSLFFLKIILKAEYTQPEWAVAFAKDPTGKERKPTAVRLTSCTIPRPLKAIPYVDLFNLGEQYAEHALLDGLKPCGKPAQPPPFPGKRLLFPPITGALIAPHIGSILSSLFVVFGVG